MNYAEIMYNLGQQGHLLMKHYISTTVHNVHISKVRKEKFWPDIAVSVLSLFALWVQFRSLGRPN